MNEREEINRLREEIKNLELENLKLEKVVLKRYDEFEKIRDRLAGQVAERTRYLREQKEQLQAITENVPGVVYQFYVTNSGDAGVNYASPKLYEIFGVEFIDDPPLFLQTFIKNIHRDDLQSWIESVQHVVEKQIPWNWKGRYIKPSGEMIWFEGHAIPTVRENEIVFDGLFIDITEKMEREAGRLKRVTQQEELKKLASLKTMAGAIGHRFNNTMMAVEGHLELILLGLPVESREYLMASKAVKAAEEVSHIGSTMLSYLGEDPLQLQELSFPELVEESVVSFKRTLQSSVSLTVIPPGFSLNCFLDKRQLKEVLNSILTNAIESFDDTAGTVEISFGQGYFTADSFPLPFQDEDTRDGSYVFCEIKDTGNGIRSENLSRIFEPFYTTKSVGRGLGLALPVGILLQHHGAILVDSVQGTGTTVKVLLPSSSFMAKNISSVPSNNIAAKTVQLSGHVLLADDEPILLRFCKMMLERLGFTVHTVENGHEAVQMVRDKEIDFCVVVLDILMPEMNGIDAMKEIRKINSTLPVLLISGYSQEEIPVGDDKPDGFMTKPVQFEDLRDTFEVLLAGSS